MLNGLIDREVACTSPAIPQLPSGDLQIDDHYGNAIRFGKEIKS
jgi:hypothetical protein